MIIVALVIIGLAFGSFVNALVWRLHEQLDIDGNARKLSKKQKDELSISMGRSMCPNCKHVLAAKDLVPVLSWLMLGGKCRYCKKPISPQYPLIEILLAVLFVVSYIAWPTNFTETWQIVLFINWLVAVVGLVAIAIYDIKWMLVPNKILKIIAIIAIIATISSFVLGRPLQDIGDIALAITIGGGIFWVLYQVSKGKWIGGGDVKLGFFLGFVLATPGQAFLYIFIASILGSLVALPLLAIKKVSNNTRLPFGPFLIAGAFIAMLWGPKVIDRYMNIGL